MTTRHLVIFGHGYTAKRLSQSLPHDGWRVSATHRRKSSADSAEAERITELVFDGSAPSRGVRDALATATHVLVSVPPDQDGCPVLRHHAPELQRAPALGWVGYLSTTGVYGDRRGGWVDESTPPAPRTSRARRRLRAEHAWLELAGTREIHGSIFRLSGIYGPGRSQLDRLREGSAKRLVGHGSVFNRIHVDDIVGAIRAELDEGGPGGIYNISDDLPAALEDVIVYAAELLGVEPPPEVHIDDADVSPMLRSFYEESRRVGNDRMTDELGYRLRYPTYREGLEALAAAEEER